MSKHSEKTNVCRLLDSKEIRYAEHVYPPEEAISAAEVAALLRQPPERVFKTLVTEGKSGKHYVFVIPGPAELDLKKAAAAVGEKAVSMLKSRELLPLTGYVHGGCSPIGMKKLFQTVLHESALSYPTIFISAGKRGFQLELPPESLGRVIPLTLAPLI